MLLKPTENGKKKKDLKEKFQEFPVNFFYCCFDKTLPKKIFV